MLHTGQISNDRASMDPGGVNLSPQVQPMGRTFSTATSGGLDSFMRSRSLAAPTLPPLSPRYSSGPGSSFPMHQCKALIVTHQVCPRTHKMTERPLDLVQALVCRGQWYLSHPTPSSCPPVCPPSLVSRARCLQRNCLACQQPLERWTPAHTTRPTSCCAASSPTTMCAPAWLCIYWSLYKLPGLVQAILHRFPIHLLSRVHAEHACSVSRNVMLQARVAVNVHWDHVSLWALTVASVLMYVGTRLYYLISGKSATLSGGSVNIPFTWMSIVADAALAILGIYLHQNFWKQTVKFTPIPDVEIQEIHRVRPPVSYTHLRAH